MDRYRECANCKGKVGDDYPGLHCIRCGGKIKAPANQQGQHRIETRKKVADAA